MFKVFVRYPSYDEEYQIAERTTGSALPALVEALHRDEILHLQDVVRRVPAAPSVIHYALELVRLTRPGGTAGLGAEGAVARPASGDAKSVTGHRSNGGAAHGVGSRPQRTLPLIDRLVTFGAGPRAVQFLLLGGKARAVMQGRKFVSIDDIRALAHAVLRHRIITNFAAEAENYDADAIIDHVLDEFPPRQIDEMTDAGVEKVFGS